MTPIAMAMGNVQFLQKRIKNLLIFLFFTIFSRLLLLYSPVISKEFDSIFKCKLPITITFALILLLSIYSTKSLTIFAPFEICILPSIPIRISLFSLFSFGL